MCERIQAQPGLSDDLRAQLDPHGLSRATSVLGCLIGAEPGELEDIAARTIAAYLLGEVEAGAQQERRSHGGLS